jgi:CheY-like chemotaxis protein
MHALAPRPRGIDLTAPVLIIDDTDLVLAIMAPRVQRLGFETVDTAGSGAEALEMMRHKAYGFILCDLQMEGADGLDVLRAVRADAMLGGPRFILMTSTLNTDAVIAARRLGADDFLSKPFSPIDLQRKLEALA